MFPFRDEQLEKILADNQVKLEKYLDELNELSKDIKQLERVLSHFAVSEHTMYLDKEESEYLYWSGYRINYFKGKDYKALCECKKEIRIKCKEYLPQFFKECMEKI